MTKEIRRYWKEKEEALVHTLWKDRFGKRYGSTASKQQDECAV
jgi:hypothetical protein